MEGRLKGTFRDRSVTRNPHFSARNYVDCSIFVERLPWPCFAVGMVLAKKSRSTE